MRHDLAAGHPLSVLLLLAHAAATWTLTGVVWTVQLVVYPAFLRVGPTPGWAAHHREHSAAINRVVALPWAVQGVTCALLLREPAPLTLAAGGLGLATVVLTLAVQVPLHTRLGERYDEELARRLLRGNRCIAVWTASGLVALALLRRGLS